MINEPEINGLNIINPKNSQKNKNNPTSNEVKRFESCKC
jgi:hypothetical protein